VSRSRRPGRTGRLRVRHELGHEFASQIAQLGHCEGEGQHGAFSSHEQFYVVVGHCDVAIELVVGVQGVLKLGDRR
jgi:hypothetical protein